MICGWIKNSEWCKAAHTECLFSIVLEMKKKDTFSIADTTFVEPILKTGSSPSPTTKKKIEIKIQKTK